MQKIDWNEWWKGWSNFQEKQIEFEKALDRYDYVLYGGAAGGGKSYSLRKYPIKFLLNCWYNHKLKGVRVGLFCEDYPTLWDRHINRIPYEFPKWLGTYHAQTHEFTLKEHFGGGVIAFRNLDDPSKYLSSEFALILVDELTKNKRETFDFLRMRLRWSGLNRVKFGAGTNPGEIGHEWVKRLWIDRKFDPEERSADQFHFIQAKATDNKYLSQSYYSVLDSLPEKMRKAYRDGNWDVFAGQYFTEWLKDVHVIEPFEIPKDWKRFRAYDHGREAPACCLWFALDYDGRLYAYKEYYPQGKDYDEIAKEIVRLSDNEVYEYSVADPSIFNNTGFTGKYGEQTIAEGFARNGITFYPASNRRIDGWAEMHKYLRWDDNTKPMLQVFSVCVNLIRTLPALIHDDIKPEDVDTDSEDHCFTHDTLIDTAFGKRRIKDLCDKSVLVNTLGGFSRCQGVRNTRTAQVYKLVLSDGREIKATADHRFLTSNGWKALINIDLGTDVLIQSDICIQSYLRLFKSLMVFGITSVGSIFKRTVEGFTSPFGSSTMATYLKDFISIIKITIEATTEKIISHYCQKDSTYPYTQAQKNIKREVENVLISTQDQRPQSGTDQRMAENGIEYTQSNQQKGGSILERYAKYAEGPIRLFRGLLAVPSSVISIVKCVPCGVEEVYNLTVPSIENFTVNGGIVVHNCGDATRYMLLTMHDRKSAKPLNDVERKLQELKRSANISPQGLNSFYIPK